MIRYAILGSGSGGNSYAISHHGNTILVDAGFSWRELQRRLVQSEIEIESLQALFITHLHPDHARGAGVLARAKQLPVYFRKELGTHPQLKALKIPSELQRPFELSDTIEVTGFVISAMETLHDSPFSVAYTIEVSEKRLMVLTDTGVVTPRLLEGSQDVDVLFLEANYDEQLLKNGPYPASLKARITSQQGHLSNQAACEVLETVLRESSLLKRVYLCHLSKTNNHPEVLKESLNHLVNSSVTLTICHNDQLYVNTIT